MPTSLYGGPAVALPLPLDLLAVIGQQRVLVIVGPPTKVGVDTKYQVLGFAGASVVSVGLLLGPSVTVQLAPAVDATATLGGGPSTGPGQFVYRGVSLTR
jgi:hypothetical protein